MVLVLQKSNFFLAHKELLRQLTHNLNLFAAEPPITCFPGIGGVSTGVQDQSLIIKSEIFPISEEICLPIAVLHGRVQIARDALPVRDRTREGAVH